MENTWEKALKNLRSEVNDQVFTAWFLPLHFVSSDDDSITLGVPNKFFENWIKEKYISLITSAVHQVSEKPLAISFKVVEGKKSLTQEAPNVLPENNIKIKHKAMSIQILDATYDLESGQWDFHELA